MKPSVGGQLVETILNAVLRGENNGEKAAYHGEKTDGARLGRIDLPASHVSGPGFESPHIHHLETPTPPGLATFFTPAVGAPISRFDDQLTTNLQDRLLEIG